MPRLKSITIENYRSIESPITINFPENKPVIIIGENNSGKTNILRAIDILFGESHPAYKDFDDHDYFGRNSNEKTKIRIEAEVEGFNSFKNKEYKTFILEKSKNEPNKYKVLDEKDKEIKGYISNEEREKLISIFISSDRNLNYQLSYSSKHTLLSKVMKSFHNKLTSDKKRVEKLKGTYQKTLEIFDEVQEFKEFKDKMSSITGNFIQNMTHALELDFSAYDPSNYFKNLQVLPKDENNILNFDELGTGQEQILALSFAYAYAKCFKNTSSLILLIDEPEAHLHPLAQKWLAKTLFEIAQQGLQIVISTHSPYFIDLNYLEGMYIVRKVEGKTEIINKTQKDLAEKCKNTGVSNTDEEKVIPFYSKSATSNILKGLFANKIVLVEGLTEEISLPIYLEAVGLDILER